MAFARDTYTATGGQTNFAITFSYITDPDHIDVYQNGSQLTHGAGNDFTISGGTTVVLNSGATADDTIAIIRNTSRSTRLVDWSVPSAMTETDLDNDSLQAFYMAQEALDTTGLALLKNAAATAFAGESLQIKSVADPTAAQDAATKAYVDTVFAGGSVTGTLTSLSVDGGTLTFNESGGDYDARFEGDTDANLLFLDASTDRIGIGTETPDGKLHVHTASAGSVTAPTDADELVLENSAAAGMTILTPNNAVGAVMFGDPDDNDIGGVAYDHNTDQLQLTSGASVRLTVSGSYISTGALPFFVNETENANQTIGVTLNQAGNDDEIFTLKSSDISHSVTSDTEADTFLYIKKLSGASGSPEITGFNDNGATSLSLTGIASADNTNKTTSASGVVNIYTFKESGNDRGALGADANALVVRDAGGALFVIDEDGDFLYDGADGGAFDEYEDAKLIRALSHTVTPRNIIRDQWDEFVQYNEEDLVSAGILGAPVKDGGMINGAQLQRLECGAIWQLHTQVQELHALNAQLTERLEIAEAKMLEAPNG